MLHKFIIYDKIRSMFSDIQKITKSNLLKGIPWYFGVNWPGKRCEAKTMIFLGKLGFYEYKPMGCD